MEKSVSSNSRMLGVGEFRNRSSRFLTLREGCETQLLLP